MSLFPPGTTAKDAVLRMVQGLPDDCTLDEIEYHLNVMVGIAKSIKEIDEGRCRTYTHEEVKRMVAEWLEDAAATADPIIVPANSHRSEA